MSGSVALQARREGEVLVVAANGEATVNSLRVLRQYIAAELCRHDARAVVVDFSEAHPRMTEAEWVQAGRDAATSKLSPPIAMVVPPAYEEIVALHCFEVASQGVLRVVFTCLDRAISWAAQRYEHWQDGPLATLTWHEPVRPSSVPRLRLVR